MDPLAPVRAKIRGTPGCQVFRHLESVDPRVAEGLKRQDASGSSSNNGDTALSKEELERLMEEEKRRSITDSYQLFLYDAKVMNRKGNFKDVQGELIVRRIREILDHGAAELNLANFTLFDNFCINLLAPYLRAKSCKLTVLNLSGTQVGVNGAVAIARAANPLLHTLQFSPENAIPVLQVRKDVQVSHHVQLSGRNYNHVDAAVLGTLMERERKQLEVLDVSRNNLTGPRSNVFHGLSMLVNGLKRCLHLKELNLHAIGLRSEGLVELANAMDAYTALEILILSRNAIACNGCGEKSIAGVEAFCGALWQTKKLARLSLADNELDYLSCIPIANMLSENRTLTTLDLSQNPVSEAGAVHLAAAVKKNAVLLSINLSGCQLGPEAVAELSSSLRKFNRTLQCIDLRENPDASSRAGYRDLVKAVSVNPSLTQIELTPPPSAHKRYDRYMLRIRECVHVNAVLQRLRKGFQVVEFANLNNEQRTNFVEKLRELSEQELQKLHAMHVMEDLRLSTEEKAGNEPNAMEIGSNLRYFSTLAKTAPLKRLLWVLETGERQTHLQERSDEKEGSEKRGEYDDDDDVWDYPLC